MRRICLLGLVLGVWATSGVAQTAASGDDAEADLEAVASETKKDLKAALAELSRVREEIADEKIPLARKRSKLEAEIEEKRQALRKAQRARDNQLVELNALKSEVDRLEKEHEFLAGLFDEHVKQFETRVHISESGRYEKTIEEAKAAQGNADLSPKEALSRQGDVVEASVNRLDEVLGGHLFSGSALSQEGILKEGEFALVGPIALFAAADDSTSGIVELQLGAAEPSVINMPSEFKAKVQRTVSQKEGEIPVDPTMGDAQKIAATQEGWVEHMMKGGPVMIPILLLAGATLVISVFKWAQLAKVRAATSREVEAILAHIGSGKEDEAKKQAQAIPGPSGEMLVEGVKHAKEKKEHIEEVLYEKMINTRPQLERLLPMVALTAATAPLLGLLGTVTGMINTFKLISAFGTGDPQALSSGISEALVTTEFGLMVAVPSLLIHAVLNRKVKGVIGSMERNAVGFINGLPAEKAGKQ